MFVAKIRRLKEETVTFTEMRDIENLVVTTMGEDVWLAILDFTQGRIEELEDEIKAAKDAESEIRSYDSSLCALTTGIQDEIETIEKLVSKINDSKRLDRKYLIKELKGIIKRLTDNEGYF